MDDTKPTGTGNSRPIVTKTGGTFQMACTVTCTIHASPERVWSLLTDAEGFPTWCSAVTSVAGKIALGERLELRVPSAPKRVFKPKVTQFEPAARMEWSDGTAPMFKGVRTFTLDRRDDGSTDFTMVEALRGIMLPMLRGSLPDFAPVFEAYATDLGRAAEGGVS